MPKEKDKEKPFSTLAILQIIQKCRGNVKEQALPSLLPHRARPTPPRFTLGKLYVNNRET
jgi:hypothetical protein